MGELLIINVKPPFTTRCEKGIKKGLSRGGGAPRTHLNIKCAELELLANDVDGVGRSGTKK